MNEQEIRKALNAIPAGAKIPKEYCEAVNILLDLAQAYLSTPEGWPKKEKVKRICKHGYKIHLGCTQWNDEDISDFNRAIDLCLLARLKEKAEFRNEYGQCYICKKRMPLVCKDCKKAEWEQKMEGLPDVIYKIERQTCAANECLPTCPSTAEGNFCGVRERVKKLYDSIRGYLMGKGEK